MLKTMRKSAAATDESGRILAALRAGVDPANSLVNWLAVTPAMQASRAAL